MSFKYSLIDDDSNLTIGYCNTIQFSNASVHSVANQSDQLALHLFTFTEEFKQYIIQRKESFSRLAYIGILNKHHNVIGRYPIFIHDDIKYHKLGFPTIPVQLNLNISSDDIPSVNQLQLWERWRECKPTQKNEWAIYDEDGKRDWLNIVSLYHDSHRIQQVNDSVPKRFELDGTCIVDYCSFFCAIGEAVNGAGGYFGKNINSMIDCTYGGYGALSPFTLIWTNSHITKNSLDQHAWQKEIEAVRQENNHIDEEDFFEEIGDRPLIDAVVENLEQVGVTIILK
ncbi:barstar family protein [Paenibacillus kyungheensis]